MNDDAMVKAVLEELRRLPAGARAAIARGLGAPEIRAALLALDRAARSGAEAIAAIERAEMTLEGAAR